MGQTISRHFGRYKGGCMILCKCPHCEAKHLERYSTQQIVMPRRLCPDCVGYRYVAQDPNADRASRRRRPGSAAA